MARQRLTESPEKMKQRIVWRESRPASAPSFPGGLHPLLQLQRTLGNCAVEHLIQAKLAVSQPAGNRAVAARLERRPATKDERRAPVQRWPIWPPQPPKQPVDDYAGWAHPDFGRHYDLKNYSIDQDNRQHELAALFAIQITTIDLINLAIDREKVGLEQLDRIRRDDIWPNWGTLHHALTAVGVLASCLEGACIVGLIMGAIDLYDSDTGTALDVAKDCLPKPKPECARALTLGAAKVASDRLEKSATTKRLGKKEQAALTVANSRIARQKLEGELF